MATAELERREVSPDDALDTLTIDEAAARLRVSTRFLRKQVARGAVPGAFRVGWLFRIGRAAFEAWVSGRPAPARREVA